MSSRSTKPRTRRKADQRAAVAQLLAALSDLLRKPMPGCTMEEVRRSEFGQLLAVAHPDDAAVIHCTMIYASLATEARSTDADFVGASERRRQAAGLAAQIVGTDPTKLRALLPALWAFVFPPSAAAEMEDSELTESLKADPRTMQVLERAIAGVRSTSVQSQRRRRMKKQAFNSYCQAIRSQEARARSLHHWATRPEVIRMCGKVSPKTIMRGISEHWRELPHSERYALEKQQAAIFRRECGRENRRLAGDPSKATAAVGQSD